METLKPVPAALSPNPEPAPEGLFGESESLDALHDAHSLWRLMTGENTKFFDLPVLEQLHRRPYSLLRLRGSFRLAKLIKDYRAQLFRSEGCQTPRGKTHIDRLLLVLGDGVFVAYEASELLVYAPTPKAAAEVAARLDTYRRSEDDQPGFRLISIDGNHPSTQLIALEQSAPLGAEDIGLHYGADFAVWEAEWLGKLRQRRSGVSILFGPPGCGKTTYLRSLMDRLIGQFAFYYIPVSAFDLLSSPNFVKFWMDEKEEARGRQKIAIMEDAEELLLPRDEGSRTKVANLLNIGDGFLGEHLRLHVIATTNSPMRQLDSALLRPGRLMGTREFRRLTRPEAQRLAEVKGLVLPEQEDFSLAELYCGAHSSPVLNTDRQIGFAK